MNKIVSLLSLFIFFNCDTENECTRRLPKRAVDVKIVKNLDGIKLKNQGYLIYDNQGIQGVIIYNSSNGYRAYDLASPHLDHRDENSKLELTDDTFQLKNKNDGALFLLNTGQPLNGISHCPLKEYRVYENATAISIIN